MSSVLPHYEICSSRFCNICLFFELQKQKNGSKPSALPSQDKLRFCSNCKLVKYCSTIHQRFDWPAHREFCLNIVKIMKSLNITHPLRISGQPFNSITMERNIIQLKYLLRILIQRPLSFHEEELTSFPGHCEVCYKFDHLQICMKCMGVSYCSPDHKARDRERHKKMCTNLKLYYCPYKLQQQIPAHTLIEDLHRPVRDMLTTDLLGAFQEMTSKIIVTDPTISMPDYQLFACAGDFSCVGTICFALRFATTFEQSKKKFIIFIVGATVEKELWFRPIHTKWFFLQYPQIKKLELYFIGPEVIESVKNDLSFLYKGVERTVTYKSFRMLFQDFTKQYVIHPSLIVAFNCGFSANCMQSLEEKNETCKFAGVPCDGYPKTDTWDEGISEIIHNYEVPIVFTSFTKSEAIFDYGALQHVAHKDGLTTYIKRLFDVKLNPYRDVRPFRNWQETHDDPIFFRNNYVQAIITRLTKKDREY